MKHVPQKQSRVKSTGPITASADFPGSFTDRNRRLASQLRRLSLDATTYESVKAAGQNFRGGRIDAHALYEVFFTNLKYSEESLSAFLDMADLMPTVGQRLELLATLPETCSTSSNVPPSPGGKQKSRTQTGPQNKKQKRATDFKGGVLYWLRQDLRLVDNEALVRAAADATANNAQVTFTYIHSPDEDGNDTHSWRPGAASRFWLHHALSSLDKELRYRYGASIIFRKADYYETLVDIAAGVGAGAVYFSKRYEPAMMHTDLKIAESLKTAGLHVSTFNTSLLREPGEVKLDMSTWRGHFGTLMPYYAAFEKVKRSIGKPLEVPKTLPVPKDPPVCTGSLEDLGLAAMPRRKDGTCVDWGQGIKMHWGDMSESDALVRLSEFIHSHKIDKYEKEKGLADGRGVTHLSPYIHFGQLSPRYIWNAFGSQNCKKASPTLWRRLIWRELSYWQLYHFPHMATRPLRTSYAAVEWREDKAVLRAWQKGQTGYPLVDAGMRQLWTTGWMQQNTRMAVACLLTEYLNTNWIHGAQWFHDTLVDADVAINSSMWQNAGKSGLDQWNYTVLPTSKSQDPNGDYIVQWVPELRGLPPKYRHEPWLAPTNVLDAAGVTLGTTYPHRIDATDARQLRRANTQAIRVARMKSVDIDAGGYDTILVPEGCSSGLDGRRIRIFTKKDYIEYNSNSN